MKLLENPLLMAVVLTAGGSALLVVKFPLFGKKPPLMAVVLAESDIALLAMELPLFGKKPPLMAVVLAAGGIAMFVVETPMLWKKPLLMAVVLAVGRKAVVAAETPPIKLAVTPLLTACMLFTSQKLLEPGNWNRFLLNNVVIFVDIQFSQHDPYDMHAYVSGRDHATVTSRCFAYLY